jgi:hypothetical protein
LAVDNFMEVIGRLDISRFHSYLIRTTMIFRAAFEFYKRSSRRSCFHITGFVNRAIEYDQQSGEKPFLLTELRNWTECLALMLPACMWHCSISHYTGLPR